MHILLDVVKLEKNVIIITIYLDSQSIQTRNEDIRVLHYFRKKHLIPLIICKNHKHLVTLYNVIFSKYDRTPVTFELYIILTEEGSNMPLKWICIGKRICVTNTQTFIPLKTWGQEKYLDKIG